MRISFCILIINDLVDGFTLYYYIIRKVIRSVKNMIYIYIYVNIDEKYSYERFILYIRNINQV